MDKDEVRTKHESFGLISFSRVSGGDTKFFGSDLSQQHYIAIEIAQAEQIDDLLENN